MSTQSHSHIHITYKNILDVPEEDIRINAENKSSNTARYLSPCEGKSVNFRSVKIFYWMVSKFVIQIFAFYCDTFPKIT